MGKCLIKCFENESWNTPLAKKTSTVLNRMAKALDASINVISFDGGGCRVLSSLMCLDRVMKQIAREKGKEGHDLKPCKYFQLIGGTSAGGIAAIMLGRLGMTVPQCIVAFKLVVKRVFRDGKHLLYRFNKYKSPYLVKGVKEVLRQQGKQTDERLLTSDPSGQNHCRTFVTAVRNDQLTENTEPILFRSYPAPCSEFELQDTKIFEAIRAAAAAPRSFSPINIGGVEWVDAALGFSNPGAAVLSQARKIWPDRKIGVFISLGTGKREPVGNAGRSNPIRNFLNMFRTIKNLATDTQKVDAHLTHELDQDVFFRFNVDAGVGGIHIADWRKLEDLETLTNKYLDKQECIERVNILVQKLVNPPVSKINNGGEMMPLEIPTAARLTDFPYAEKNLPSSFEKIKEGFKLHSEAIKSYKEMVLHRKDLRLFEAARSKVRCKYLFKRSEDEIAESLGTMAAEYAKTHEDRPLSEATLLRAKLAEVCSHYESLKLVDLNNIPAQIPQALPFHRAWFTPNPNSVRYIILPHGQILYPTSKFEATWRPHSRIDIGFESYRQL